MKQKVAEWINIIFGFRKFLAWACLFLVAIVFRLKNYVDGGQFVDLMKTTFMGFVAANGFEHIMTTVKDYVKGKAAAQAVEEVADTDESNDEKETAVGG